MKTLKLFPIEDTFVERHYRNKSYYDWDKIFIMSDSCARGFSATNLTHEVCWGFLKFKLPNDINPYWVNSIKLHIYIKDARFVGSTVEVTNLALNLFYSNPDWDERTLNNKVIEERLSLTYITKVILKSCEELGDLCGKRGWCQVGPSFELGHVFIDIPFWRFYDNYLSLVIQPGADNNGMWFYSKAFNTTSIA